MMMMIRNEVSNQRILIVEDAYEIAQLVRSYLEQADFQVFVAHDGTTAMHILRREQPDLVILDLRLPDQDGLDIARFVRHDAQLKETLIIMLTARVTDDDKLEGLEVGADDYITKPFNPREVVARVRAILRRSDSAASGPLPTVLRCGDLTMDLKRYEVKCKDVEIKLTPTEFKLLQIMMEDPGYVFTRQELIKRGLGYEYEGMDRTLDTHIKNLRKKIEPDSKNPAYILTVYGVGYRLGEA